MRDHGALVTGFNVDFVDLSGEGRLDVILREAGHLVWLQQPEDPAGSWPLHAIGTIEPDNLVGFVAVDITGNGRHDIFGGGYSRGPRDRDGEVGPADPLGRLAWFEQPDDPTQPWLLHDVSRRKRGMFDKFIARDLDQDGDTDLVGTRGNSAEYDGVFWLEQVRSAEARPSFEAARATDSQEMPLPEGETGGDP